MKSIVFIIILFTTLLKSNAQIKWQINKDTIISWYLTDSDEFNTKYINTDTWQYWYGWSRSIYFHKEQEYYTDGKNHELNDGNLNLYAKKERIERRMVDWLDDTTSLYRAKVNIGPNKRMFDYTSGMIQSHKKFKYGYFEIKFKIPSEKGYWPAFWLYGGTPNEEIDWMELKTEKKNAIHVGRHSQKHEENKFRNYIRKKTWGDWVYFKGNLSSEWHVISGEWTPEYLKYYLNGECIAYTKVGLHIEKNLCANLAVPGNDGAFKPGPDKDLERSGDFKIDYIRVWSSDSKANTQKNNRVFEYNQQTKLGQTKLRSKTRFLYGRKKDHVNEGITVTVLPLQNNQFELQVLGNNIPKTATYDILDSDHKVVSSRNLTYDSNIIDIANFSGDTFELKISCFDKNVSYTLTKTK